jgi:squalene-hopene cyclase-like protein
MGDIFFLAAITAGRPLNVILAVGLIGLFILLSVLAWTRLGQARPIAKCVVLSLLAHLLLLIYAYSTHILYGPPGRWTGQTVTIRLRDAADDVEAAPVASASPQPWQQAGESTAPLLLPSPERPDKKAEPEESSPPLIASAAEEKPVEPAASPPEPSPTPHDEQPQLTDLLPDSSDSASSVASALPESSPPPPTTQPTANEQSLAADVPEVPSTSEPNQFVSKSSRPAPKRLGDGLDVPAPLTARVAADRLKAAQPFGATARTETAVAAALDWLASAQSSDGRWDADAHGAGREARAVMGHDRRGAGAQADTGITGLALLAFLGSGETHLSGKHREAVQHGLEFLLGSQSREGSLAGQAELFAAMYCHGIATLSLSEAYALSGDDRLLPGLQRALQFTMNAQHSAGGWRYRPNEPTDPGDMSQFGWQLMALKSADLGGLPMPIATRIKMVRFLQSCSIGKNRGLAGYRPGERATRTMTAEALVCRIFLDAENSPAALDEGAAYVLEERPSQRAANYYYWYYGTLALFQRQGDDWQRWNAALQAELLARQRWDGASSGSFDPDDLWGGYGGRVYSTALATLSLEVYYRYLPVHGRDLDDSRLTDRSWQPVMPR